MDRSRQLRRAGPQGAGFALVTLGCPKNEADSDRLEAILSAAGHAPVAPERADLVIVNTCGFIDAAKEESIDALLDVLDLARTTGARVAAYGCLVERYRDDLARELPEVDVFAGFEIDPLREALDELAAGGVRPDRSARPSRRAPLHAYVKISDGCDQRCSFCAIPLIKGRYRAEHPDEILARAGAALARGARELVLVGQDTSRWSLPGYGSLERLLVDLAGLGPHWLRLLYLQPEGVSDGLLEALSGFAVPYLDIPFQHASGPILRAMRRPGDAATYLAMLRRVRDALPGVALRSTFLVGFPGETEAHLVELLRFIAEARPAVGGVFTFDPQEGTAAASFGDPVPTALAFERAARVQDALDETAAAYWGTKVGKRLEVLVEHGTRDPEREAVGRIAVQAPDTDGVTYVRGGACRRRQTLRVRIDGVVGYDLTARVV